MVTAEYVVAGIMVKPIRYIFRSKQINRLSKVQHGKEITFQLKTANLTQEKNLVR